MAEYNWSTLRTVCDSDFVKRTCLIMDAHSLLLLSEFVIGPLDLFLDYHVYTQEVKILLFKEKKKKLIIGN